MSDFLSRIAKLSPQRLALLANELNERLEAMEDERSAPIAIVGMGCRLPGGVHDAERFWNLLSGGVDAIREVPSDRWKIDDYYHPVAETPGKMNTRWGGFIDGPDQFDPRFFGIAPAEAISMDPQQRLLLETAWEALEDAGIPPASLAGSATGVFVGLCNLDYGYLALRAPRESITPYVASGLSHAVAAGRISYLLGLEGPSLAVDTSCSASLMAVHLACQSLRKKESHLALAGGANLILTAEVTIALSQSHMMAPDGRCKAFSDQADGFVRAEGGGMIVLKRLQDAVRDGNRILAIIRGSAANQDGRSSGLTAPNGRSQEAVITAALADARLKPDDIQYVEAHGTGTSLGDPIEVGALAHVFAERSSAGRLRIGSIKSNFGHLESAAGIAGLMKLVLSLQHREIPATLHCSQPNHRIEWNKLPIQVAQRKESWDSYNGRRIGGVSSFGFSGTNVHVVLEEHRNSQAGTGENEAVTHPLLFPLSAKTPTALFSIAARLDGYLATHPRAILPSVSRTLNTGRSHFEYRAAFVAASREELLDALRRFSGQPTELSRSVSRSPRIAFLFADHQAIATNAGRDLYEAVLPFRAAIERCDVLLQPQLGCSLVSMLYPASGPTAELPESIRPLASFAFQYAMAELWRSCGIEPALIAGDGSGECVAACLSEALSLEEALGIAAKWSKENDAAEYAHRLSWSILRIPWLAAKAGEKPWLLPARLADTSSLPPQKCSGWLSMAALFPQSRSNLTTEPEFLGRRIGCQSHEPGDLQSFLHVAAEMYALGCDPDLTRIYSESPAPIVSLPSYPFERQRYWIETAPTPVPASLTREAPDLGKADDWLYELSWEPRPIPQGAGVSESYEKVLGELVAAEPNPALLHLAEAGPRVRRLCASYVIEVLQRLGAERLAGRSLSVDQVCDELKIAPSRRRVVGRLLRILVEDEVLAQEDELYSFSNMRPLVDTASEHAALQSMYPEIHIELEILKRCANKTPAVLQGEYDPMQLVFAEGSVQEAEQIYQNSPVCRYFNSATCDAMERAIAASPARKVRILEMGAGTGATTASVLPPIAQHNIEYTFTDISPVFLSKAREKFRDIPGVSYRLLNIERSPGEQGFVPGTYDIVMAANVLHATADLQQTVEHTRELLRPGGLLMLIEGAWPDRWLDLTFGLTDGWWRFTDYDLRPEHPLVSVEKWHDLFKQHGMSVTRTIRYAAAGEPSQQVLMLACADSEPISPAPTSQTASRWIVLSDNGGIGEALVPLLHEAGQQCELVTSAVLLRGPETLIRSLRDRWPQEEFQFVYLCSVDAAATDAADQNIDLCAQLPLRWMKAMSLADSAANLWLITHGAQGSESFPLEAEGAFQSMVWGLGRVFGLESPSRYKKLIDLDPEQNAQQNAALLLRELLHDDAEDQVIYRGRERLVPRLRRRVSPNPEFSRLRLRADASYLITGGLGAVGRHLTRWVAESGAGHIVVLSRGGLKSHPESASLIDEVAALGCGLTIVEGDVASPATMERTFALFGSKCPPLRGVFHVATAQSVAGIGEISDQQLAEMLQPKVLGTLLLHEWTRRSHLDFFIAFSSTTSVLGSRGMAHYAAANQFLDNFAQVRRAQNLPMLSINWGAWQQDQDSADASLLAQMGLLPMDVSSALDWLSQTMHSSRANIMIAKVDWKSLKAIYETRRVRPMLADVANRPATAELVPEPSRAPSVDIRNRENSVAESVACAAASVLGFRNGDIPPSDVPLTDLGLDSLMAVDLRNRLQTEFGRELPSTIVFDYPTISGLSAILESMLWVSDGEGIRHPEITHEIRI